MNECDAYSLSALRIEISSIEKRLRLVRLERDLSSVSNNADSDEEESFYIAMSSLNTHIHDIEIFLLSLYCELGYALGFDIFDYVIAFGWPLYPLEHFDEVDARTYLDTSLAEVKEYKDSNKSRGMVNKSSDSDLDRKFLEAEDLEEEVRITMAENEQITYEEDRVRYATKLKAIYDSKLSLNAALDISYLSNGVIQKYDYGNFDVIVLGRYFRRNQTSHNTSDGMLSRMILAAKKDGYPPEIIDSLSALISNFPEGTVITAIPDKRNSSCNRMIGLLDNLKLHDELQHLSFSSRILEFTSEATTLMGLSPPERESMLKKNLYASNKGVDITQCLVVVIDDVITTGSTLSRAYQALMEMGAKDVKFIAMAKTVPKGDL